MYPMFIPQQQTNNMFDVDQMEKWIKFVKEQTGDVKKKEEEKKKKPSERVLSFLQTFAIVSAVSVPVGMGFSYLVVLTAKGWATAMLTLLK